MKNRTRSVESLKTLLIVVLIISAILLLYFLWKNETFDEFRTPIDIFQDAQKPIVSNPASFIVPESMTANLGTNSEGPYKLAGSRLNEYWESFINNFKTFSLSENIYVEEIKKEQWIQAKELTSLTIDFNYSINFLSLCALFEINRPSAYNAIENITTLLYSEGSKESIIIFDGKADKYYRLATMQNVGLFSSIIQEMEKNETDDYYPMSLFSGVSNTCLSPYSMQTSMIRMPYRTEVSDEDDEKIKEIAQIFFGKNFDFIRRIRETNHTTVFIYGYGEKLLTLKENGSFEYREEFSGGGTQESFHSALKIGVQYIDNHGGLTELAKAGMSAYLKNVQNIEQKKKKGYRFLFGFKKDGIPVYYENEDALVVEIVANQVIYYKRYAILPEAEYEADTADPNEKIVMKAMDVLSKNYHSNSIRETLIASGTYITDITDVSAKTDQMQSFSAIADSIDTIRTGYLKTEMINELIPVWIFSADTVDMYFDLYTGEMIRSIAKGM